MVQRYYVPRNCRFKTDRGDDYLANVSMVDCSDYTALEARCRELEEQVVFVEKNAISLLTASACKEHREVIKQMPFVEFLALPHPCEMCARQQLAHAKAEIEKVRAESQATREILWLGHGHTGVYGDDGEMQCGACLPHWDYKNRPLSDVAITALNALRDDLAAKTAECERLEEKVKELEGNQKEFRPCWCGGLHEAKDHPMIIGKSALAGEGK